MATVFHFFIFEQGTLHCRFALSPANHAAGLVPNTVLSVQDIETKQTSTLKELQVSILPGKQILHNKQDIQGQTLMCLFFCLFVCFFKFYFIFKLYITVLVLPNMPILFLGLMIESSKD